MRRLLATTIGLLALLAAPAAADPVPEGYTYQHAWYESEIDGAQVHAGVFLPEDREPGEKHPVLLTVTPYAAPNGGATAAGNTSGPVNRFPEFFGEDGIATKGRYAYVQVDARSFGGSGGCWEYYGVKEAIDSGLAVDWAGTQEWSNGKVAMIGKSYDAATQVLAMGQKPKHLAATIVQAPGLSGYTGLWYEGLHYATGRYATPAVYTADDLGPTQNGETATDPMYASAFADGLAQSPQCRAEQLVLANVIGDRTDPFWKDREPYLLAKGSDVPTFWSHGFYDANTKPVHLDVWESLTGPKKAWFGQYTHLRGHEGGVGRNEAFLGEVERFLDFHVLGKGPDPAEVDPVMTIQDRSGAWRREAAWPPADAKPWTMPLKAGSYVDQTGNSATSPGTGLWTASGPLTSAAHLAGEAVVSLDVTTTLPETKAIAHLYDYDPATGRATFLQRGGKAIFDAGAQEVEFKLYPQDHRFEAGHQILVRLSASDDAWWTGGLTRSTVTVTGGSLTLPLLGRERRSDLEGGPSDGMTNPFAVPAAKVQAATVDAVPPAAKKAKPRR
jgi:uncharacterized protein